MKITHLSVPVLVLLVVGSGLADTIVQTQGATLLNVGNQFGAPIEFNPFNSALGTLTSVTLKLGASFAGTVGVENLSNAPDKAEGIITGTVSIANNGASLLAEVTPSAMSAFHTLSPFDGVEDFAGTSGFTDSVAGSTLSTSASSNVGSVLQSFTGNNTIFLTLTATSFPLVEGMENEAGEETANATAAVELTYDYTPSATVPEPSSIALAVSGLAGLLWILSGKGSGRQAG